jgi:hypothetical protein
MKLRIGAYATVLGWYLIASAALIGGAYWEISRSFGGPPGQGGAFAPIALIGAIWLVLMWLAIGATTGCTLVGRWLARTEPTTLPRSFRLGTAAAGIGSLIGIAGLAALCVLAYGVAFAQHLLH